MNSKILHLALALLIPSSAFGNLKAVATTPDVAWLVKRVGGDAVEVKSLARTGDNYHFLDARPDYILAVSRAGLVCRVGADLEIGWLPKILEKAANAKVMSGAAGDCDLSRTITLQEKPAGPVDRSMGDVHAAGNPHFWLSPLEMIAAAQEVETRLAAVAPEQAAAFSVNRKSLEAELRALHAELKEKLKPLASRAFYEYHRDFTYFFRAFGLRSLGSIEEIPGVSPSAARLGRVSLEAKEKGAALALASESSPKGVLAKFSELSGVKTTVLPTSVSQPGEADAYRKWQEALANTLLQAVK